MTLRGFVMMTHVRMYMLAAVILFYCALGVFALNNVGFDMWTLFWFGLGGFVMRSFGFPIVPVILGVVLGNIAENALAQVIALSSNKTPFLTRPWSLFFILLGLFRRFSTSTRSAGADRVGPCSSSRQCISPSASLFSGWRETSVRFWQWGSPSSGSICCSSATVRAGGLRRLMNRRMPNSWRADQGMPWPFGFPDDPL